MIPICAKLDFLYKYINIPRSEHIQQIRNRKNSIIQYKYINLYYLGVYQHIQQIRNHINSIISSNFIYKKIKLSNKYCTDHVLFQNCIVFFFLVFLHTQRYKHITFILCRTKKIRGVQIHKSMQNEFLPQIHVVLLIGYYLNSYYIILYKDLREYYIQSTIYITMFVYTLLFWDVKKGINTLGYVVGPFQYKSLQNRQIWCIIEIFGLKRQNLQI
eukprot:TRINITY_DN34664_c0_g2_i1.p1 TRINITY_DN34664_c0_g2~~TRINITY_DN34664_c0_g2_i1.p1  ORF type:complete len:215 (-),score=-35.54 TRINITY_DN34664_c0_g2_i1:62-706(-)